MESDERTMWSRTAASQLRAERAFRGWTQAQMIERSGIPRSTYIRLETGARVMDVSQMARLCDALGIKPATFAHAVDARIGEQRSALIVDESGIEVPTPRSRSRRQAPGQ